MITIREYIEGKADLKISAYGTSEGAGKGWDSRGRGRAKKNFEPPSSTVQSPKNKKFEAMRKIIQDHYGLKRPVTDKEVTDEVTSIARKHKAGSMDDRQEHLAARLGKHVDFNLSEPLGDYKNLDKAENELRDTNKFYDKLSK